MDKSAYHLWDLHRILFGNAPAEFLIETLFRTAVIYSFLLLVVARLGKRMSGQVTITELAIVIMLGAIVAPPMETPERGILQGVVILIAVLWMHRTTASIGVNHPKAEKIIQGKLDICVKNGIIDIGVIRRIRVSRAELMAILRMNKIYNLGQVQRLYMEANGKFSIYEAAHSRAGLSLLPPDDAAIHSIQYHPDPALKACTSCGNTIYIQKEDQPCGCCGAAAWDTAVI